MYSQEFIASLESELDKLERQYTPLLTTYLTYLDSLDQNEDMPLRRTKFPIIQEEQRTRATLIPLAKVALEKFPIAQVFKAEDLFEAIDRPDLEFERVRTTLSRFLSQLAEEGELEKVTRGNYRRIIAALEKKDELDEDEGAKNQVSVIVRRRRGS